MTLEKRTRLKQFLEKVFKKEGKMLRSVNYVFCGDEYLRTINKDYLKHNYYTDIVTFELSEKGDPVEGEIYISVDRVKENANTFFVSPQRELHRVMIHGVLHLCGYHDKTAEQKREMRAREDDYLETYFK